MATLTKITQADLTGKGVIGLPDTPELSSTDMQEKFDEIALDVIVPHFNTLVDELTDAFESEEGEITVVTEDLEEEVNRAMQAEDALNDAIEALDDATMKTATYDTNANGVVDNSEALDGHDASYFATASDLTSEVSRAQGVEATKANASDVATALDGKVDKVQGKGLSTNDYSDADKTIVDGVTSALSGKVDKETGKGLSTNDFTTAYKNQIDTNTSNIGNLSNLTTTAKDNLVEAINEAAQSGGGASDLDDLNDVNLTNPADGQVLKYNATSSKWENGAGGGGGASTLSDLTDTAINTPTSGQALVYSSIGKWTNVTLPSASGDMRKAVYDPDDDGIIGIAQGGTGNADGYIRTGKTSASTIGTSATAEGSQTVASGNYSHAEGRETKATGGYGSHSEGYATTASGASAHAEGGSTIASGASSHAEGDQTSALSDMSHAEGFRTKVDINAWAAHAEGYSQEDYKILASAYGAHAEGATESTTYGITASGKGAHAEGYLDNNATGNHVASGNGSHVEGYQNTASGASSHAEGAGNAVSGGASHVEGMNNVAGYAMQHVQGQYNDNKRENVFEIGGGTANNRSNIFEIDENGYMSFDNGANKIKFGVDSNGNYGYIKAGADTVYPFSSEASRTNVNVSIITISMIRITYTDRPKYVYVYLYSLTPSNSSYYYPTFIKIEDNNGSYEIKEAYRVHPATSSTITSAKSYLSVSENTTNKTITITSGDATYARFVGSYGADLIS